MLQVAVFELHNCIAVCMIAPDHIHVAQLLEQRDLSDSSGRYALLLLLQADLLEGNDLPCGSVTSPVDDPIGALTNLLHLLILQPHICLLS